MSQPWTCGPALSPERYAMLLRRAIFECCKWHLHTEDRPVVCSFPLILEQATWLEISRLATALWQETAAAEQELLTRTDLHPRLGLPAELRGWLYRLPRLRAWLSGTPLPGPTPGAARVIRFDFHHTESGWRISEANSDVAGGFIEASGLTRLMAAEYSHCQAAGDPAGVLSQSILQHAGRGGIVGLMHLTTFSEDRQIMLYLAGRFAETGLQTCLFSPEQLRWDGAVAHVDSAWYAGPLDVVVRFFPAEWLPRLPITTGWHHFLVGGRTAVCNPAYAVLTQSKRFPLVWNELTTSLPTWRTLLPETCSPADLPGAGRGEWVLKPALGHEGDDIGVPGVTKADDWATIRQAAVSDPSAWAAQRRFEMLPLSTPEGTLYPCVGVYLIDGQVAGAYGRMGVRPLIDDRSRDVVVLLRSRESSPDAARNSL